MENAAKALIIAGSVLLAIIVLSIGVYLRSNLQGTADVYVETLDTNQLRKYNSVFEVYAETTKTITAQDIVTLVEFAKKSEQSTKVFVKERGAYKDKTEGEFDTSAFLKSHILREDNSKIYNSFIFDSIEYEEGKVIKIYFTFKEEKNK